MIKKSKGDIVRRIFKGSLISMCVATLVLGVGVLKPVQANAVTKYTPTIFVHGFNENATIWQAMTGNMVKYHNSVVAETFTAKSATLYPTVDVKYPRSSVGKKPLILVNLAGTINTESTNLWYIIRRVKQQYGVSKVNIVAHSMGGVIITYEMEDARANDIDKLVTIGSPIKGTVAGYLGWLNRWTAWGLIPTSPYITGLVRNKTRFDRNTKVYSIETSYKWYSGGDGVVSYASAYGLKSIVASKNIIFHCFPNIYHTARSKDANIIANVEYFLRF